MTKRSPDFQDVLLHSLNVLRLNLNKALYREDPMKLVKRSGNFFTQLRHVFVMSTAE